MHKRVWTQPTFVITLSMAVGLLGAVACGSPATPTPVPPTATNTPGSVATNTPTATPKPAASTPTSGAGAAPVVATPTATATPTPVPTVKPKRGGTLKVLASEDPKDFDVQNATTSAWTVHIANIYNNLLWNPDGHSIAPDAAESYSISADGRVWTFKLRGDVRFQSYQDNPGPRDGTLMTAADVVYSLKKIMGLIDGIASTRSGFMKEFVDTSRPDQGVVAVDARTVQVFLKGPFPDLAKVLVLGNSGLYPEGTTTDMLTKRPYGSGPFKLKGFQRGAAWKWGRNPDYFAGGPYLDELDMLIIPGGSAISQAAFLSGQIEVASGVPTPGNRAIYKKRVADGKIVVNPVPGTCTVQGVYMNSTKPPFNNPKLRKAVNLAIDRKAYIDVVYNGDAVPVTYVPSGNLPWEHTADEIWKMPGYRQPKDQDLAEAKRIMAEEYPQGLTLTLYARNSGSYPAAAEFNAGDLKKIGINVTINLMDSTVLFPRLTAWDYEIASYCMTMITMTPADQFGTYYITGGARNWLAYTNPKIDEMYPKMVAAQGEEQAAMIRQMEQFMFDYIPWAPEASVNDSFNWYSYVQGYPLADPGLGFTYYSAQRLSQVWRNDI